MRGKAVSTARWETRHVRAYNVRSGDVLSFFDTKRMREVKRTVDAVAPSEEWPGDVEIRFRRWRWGLHLKRGSLVRVRRKEKP